MGNTPQHVYASHLRQNLGYPLRNPRPNSILTQPYSEEGFQIGDVGYVDDYGEFNLVFNINFPPEELQGQNLSFPPDKPIQFAQPVASQAINPNTVLMTGVERNLRPSPRYFHITIDGS